VKILSAFVVLLLLFQIQGKMQEALKLFSSGDVDGAAALFQEIIQENPQHGPARLMLGQIALERGEIQQAQQHLEIAVASNPQRIQLAWHLLGRVYLFQKQYQKAVDAFDQSLKESSDFKPALLERARTKIFLNQIDGAIEDLQKINEPESELLLGEVLLYSGRAEQAREHFTNAIEKEPAAKLFLEPEKNLKILLGENLAIADAYLAAAIRLKSPKLFLVAYNIDDQNPVIRLFLQKSGQEIPNFSLPKPVVVQTVLSASNALEIDSNLAEGLATKITNDRPMHIPALLIQLESAEKLEDKWDALHLYKQIFQTLPDIPTILLRFALLARDIEANNAAECAIQKALSIKPDDGSLYYIQATILKQEEKVDAALAACQKAIELGFKEAPLYVTLGNLYYEKMEISESIDAFQTAIEKDPESAENIASFALSSLTTPDSAKLTEILEKHVETHPENINTLYSLGVLYLNENKFDKAKEYFLKLTKLAPNNSQVYYNLSLLYTREGNDAEAKQALSRFDELKNEERKEFLHQNQMYRLRIEAAEAKKNGDINNAIYLYSQVIELGSQEKGDLLALGELYLKSKTFKEAATSFEKVLRKWPYDVKAKEGSATAYDAIQNTELAQQSRFEVELLSSFCQ
jgi:tetratricopeptide (TPR) repeat protein